MKSPHDAVYRRKAKRLMLVVTYKRREDRECARVMQKILNHHYRKPEVRAETDLRFKNLILYGHTHPELLTEMIAR